MSRPSLIWARAEFDRGTLKVPIEPTPPAPDWHEAFGVAVGTLAQDAEGIWGQVTLEHIRIEVTDVPFGESAVLQLRRFLEALIVETEKELARRRSAGEQRKQRQMEELRAQKAQDDQMTEWFRA
jgi:hypothetical protein